MPGGWSGFQSPGYPAPPWEHIFVNIDTSTLTIDMAQVYCHLFGEGSYQDFTPSSSFPDARLKIRWLMFSILTFSIGIFIVLLMIEVMLMKTLVKDCDNKMMAMAMATSWFPALAIILPLR